MHMHTLSVFCKRSCVYRCTFWINITDTGLLAASSCSDDLSTWTFLVMIRWSFSFATVTAFFSLRPAVLSSSLWNCFGELQSKFHERGLIEYRCHAVNVISAQVPLVIDKLPLCTGARFEIIAFQRHFGICVTDTQYYANHRSLLFFSYIGGHHAHAHPCSVYIKNWPQPWRLSLDAGDLAIGTNRKAKQCYLLRP